MDVCITRCASYEQAHLGVALQELLAPLGGMEAFVKPGQRVFIKPNMLEKASPERATITHPALVEAVTRLAVMAGGDVTVGDCPGAIYGQKETWEIYRVSGLEEAVERAGGKLCVSRESVPRAIANTHTVDSFDMAKDMAQCDVLINLAKLKTHTLTGFTCGVKNLFGTIVGMAKVGYHSRFIGAQGFAAFLVDLAQAVKPALSIVDCVIAHEGQGPSGGTPKPVYALAAGEDVHALDYACVCLMGLRPRDMPTLTKAQQYGLLDAKAITYPLLGPKDFTHKPFVPALRSLPFLPQLKKLIPLRLRRAVRLRPIVQKDLCIGCGACAGVCPAKAIKMENKLPRISREECQFCFCCQELCPRKAIVAGRKIRNG